MCGGVVRLACLTSDDAGCPHVSQRSGRFAHPLPIASPAQRTPSGLTTALRDSDGSRGTNLSRRGSAAFPLPCPLLLVELRVRPGNQRLQRVSRCGVRLRVCHPHADSDPEWPAVQPGFGICGFEVACRPEPDERFRLLQPGSYACLGVCRRTTGNDEGGELIAAQTP